MEVFMIRHSTPQVAKGVCYGQSEIPLAPSFADEWKLIREKLPESVDMIFSSPLSRCMQLSVLLSEHFKIPVKPDSRLMEMNFGDWEMKLWDEIDQHQLTTWMNNYLEVACPNGESYKDLRKRLKNFISDNLVSDNRKYLIVMHGGVIKCFHVILQNTDGMDYTIRYGGIYHFCGKLSDTNMRM